MPALILSEPRQNPRPELINESKRTNGKTWVLGDPGAAFDVEGLLNFFFFCLTGSYFKTFPRSGFDVGAVLD